MPLEKHSDPMKRLDLSTVPALGELPELMQACVIRKEREGEPEHSMQIEEVPVPVIGANEALVLVMAAGVNFNGVWAAQGKPVSVFRMHKEPFHIAGSDAAGIVWKVGADVRRWKPGDEVVIHCNQSCGQCPECNGLDPMACSEQKIWGYETSYGSFAQFTRVQAQQLVKKPKNLGWEEAASYGLTYFTAYRMLVDRAEVKPGDHVLVWGAAGGLGIFAVQLCKLMGAHPIAIVSSPGKAELVRSLGATMVLNRREFDFVRAPDDGPEKARHRSSELKRFGGEIRKLTGGKDPDIVFEHVGKDTFFASVFLAKRFGKIVICGATSGYDLDFDVRHLWMRQKSIIGSHFANAYQAERANELVLDGRIKPVLDRVFDFPDTAAAHQLMKENQHQGKLAIRIQAPKI
ncbi:MAG: crotonyl-CoA carboxylase/reductase [Myxococcales bacterium]|nr:crotonyl-CoA carboxylase/reductase [Myxococcales bacterium]